MSKKIYICQKFLNQSIEAIGTTKVTGLSTDNLAADAQGFAYSERPDTIQLVQTNTSKVVGSSKIYAVPSTSQKFLKGLSVVFKNQNSNDDYIASTFYKQYKDVISLMFPLYVNYPHNGITYSKTLQAIINGSEITQGYISYTIPITEQFENLTMVTDLEENVALDSISVNANLDTPAIFRNDGETLTTAIAIECLKMTSNMTVSNIIADSITPTKISTLFTATLPDSSQMGRIFLTFLQVKENSGMHCLTSYRDSSETIIYQNKINKPYPSNYIRTDDVLYDLYEYYKGTHRGSDYEEMYGQSSDTVGSSYEDDIIHKLDPSKPLTTNSTEIEWYALKNSAWFDAGYIRLIFSPTGRDTSWIPLSKAFMEGIRVASGETDVSVMLALPDLCSLLNTSFDGSPFSITEDYFLGGFYPYNPLTIDIELGYQTGYNDSYYTGTSRGIYVDKRKTRRLFIGDKEVQYFIIDNETTS